MIRQTKHTTFPLINCHCWGIAVIAVFTCLVLPQDMHAQDLGGPGGGLGIDDLQQLVALVEVALVVAALVVVAEITLLRSTTKLL